MAKKASKKAAAKPMAARPAVPARGGALAPLESRERAFDRFFDTMFDDLRHWPRLWGAERWWPGRMLAARTPAVDVYEEQDHVIVKAELPGLSKDDVQLTVDEDTLTIKGEKKKEEEVKEKDYHRWERSYGAFLRTIPLPVQVKSDAATAQFKNGVLTVRVPKSEAPGRKHIPIKVE
jgi:HSP20 family protein